MFRQYVGSIIILNLDLIVMALTSLKIILTLDLASTNYKYTFNLSFDQGKIMSFSSQSTTPNQHRALIGQYPLKKEK